jgi:cilia- and flagella-associated protein 57
MLSLSPCVRRLVAVAESCLDGPTVFVYHTRRLYRQKTLSTPEVESQVFVSVAFSPDEALLLTLGGAPDWKLVCWHLDSGKPMAVHQVTTNPDLQIFGCSFCPTNPSRIAVWGDSVLKFLSLDDDQRLNILPHSSRFTERPAQTYLAHCWLQDEWSVVSTASSDLLLFRREVFQGVLASSPSASAESDADAAPAEVMCPTENGFLTGGAHGLVRLYTASDEDDVFFERSRRFLVRDAAEHNARILSMAINPSGDKLAVVTAGADLLSLDLARAMKKEETRFERVGAGSHGPMRDKDSGWGPGDPSGACAVMGLDVCSRKPLIATAGLDGCLRLWNYIEKTQELTEAFSESIFSVALHPSGQHLLLGFSDSLKFCNLLLDEVRVVKDISIKSCRECSFANGGHLFAAANGYLIQIYDVFTCQLLVTLRGHSGAIRSIRWSQDDESLTSAGADGAVYCWNWRSGKRVREFVNKLAKYTCADSLPDGTKAFAVGTASPLLEEIDFVGGVASKAVAHDVVQGQLALSSTGKMLFSGWSGESIVGSIVAYALPIDSEVPEIVTYPGVSAEITHMKFTPDDTHLVVAGADGAVLVLEVRDKDGRVPLREAAARLPWSDEVLMTRSLLEDMARKITELSETYEELVSNNDYNMRMKEIQFQERMKKVQERYQAELDQEKTQLQLLKEETEDLQREFAERLAAMEVAHRSELQKREGMYQSEIMTEVERFQRLKAEFDASGAEQRAIRQRMVDKHERDMALRRKAQEDKLSAAQKARVTRETTNSDLMNDWRETQAQMEEDMDDEIEELKTTFEGKHEQEKTTILRYRSENGVLNKKFEALKQEIEEQEEEIRALRESHSKREKLVSDLRMQIKARLSTIAEKDVKIGEKEKQIYELKKKNQELEKYKFVLDYKIKELKRQIEPRENEIQAMRKQIKEVDAELEAYHKVNAKLDEQIGDLGRELDKLQARIAGGRAHSQARTAKIDTIKSDLESLSLHILNPDKLKMGVVGVAAKHVPPDLSVPKADPTVVDEYGRQEKYLGMNLQTLRERMERITGANKQEMDGAVKRNLSLVDESKDLRSKIGALKAERMRAGLAGGAGLPLPPAPTAVQPALPIAEWRSARSVTADRVKALEAAILAANPASRTAAGAT